MDQTCKYKFESSFLLLESDRIVLTKSIRYKSETADWHWNQLINIEIGWKVGIFM